MEANQITIYVLLLLNLLKELFSEQEYKTFPDADTPTDQDYDLPNADKKDKEAVYVIHYLKTKAL